MSDTPPILLQAVAYLEAQEHDILFLWVQIASRLPAHFRRTDDDLKALLDHMPTILAHVRRQMLEPVDPAIAADISEDLAVAHALERYGQGVSSHTIVKEYQLLRHAIWSTWERWPEAAHLSALDCFLLARHLDFRLDEFMAQTLATFVRLGTEDDGGAADTVHHPGGR